MSLRTNSWIGVDLDGTLAHYDRWRSETHIGPPVTLMLDRVVAWLVQGKTVKILTARVGNVDNDERRAVIAAIDEWCLKYIGQTIEVTATKDYSMVELWDDRCVQVIPNTGRRADGKM